MNKATKRKDTASRLQYKFSKNYHENTAYKSKVKKYILTKLQLGSSCQNDANKKRGVVFFSLKVSFLKQKK